MYILSLYVHVSGIGLLRRHWKGYRFCRMPNTVEGVESGKTVSRNCKQKSCVGPETRGVVVEIRRTDSEKTDLVQSATASTASERSFPVQTCDNIRVQSATQSIALHTLRMSKPVITLMFPVLRNRLLPYFTHVQTCERVRIQTATQSSASVHTLHMSKPVIMFVFKVLNVYADQFSFLHLISSCP